MDSAFRIISVKNLTSFSDYVFHWFTKVLKTDGYCSVKFLLELLKLIGNRIACCLILAVTVQLPIALWSSELKTGTELAT